MVSTKSTTKLDEVLNGIALIAGLVFMLALMIAMFKAVEPELTSAIESFNKFNASMWGVVGVTPTADLDDNIDFLRQITLAQALLTAGASFALMAACGLVGRLAEKYRTMKTTETNPIQSRLLVALGVCWRLAVCLFATFVVGAMADTRPPLTVAGLGAIVWCLAWRGYLPRGEP